MGGFLNAPNEAFSGATSLPSGTHIFLLTRTTGNRCKNGDQTKSKGYLCKVPYTKNSQKRTSSTVVDLPSLLDLAMLFKESVSNYNAGGIYQHRTRRKLCEKKQTVGRARAFPRRGRCAARNERENGACAFWQHNGQRRIELSRGADVRGLRCD